MRRGRRLHSDGARAQARGGDDDGDEEETRTPPYPRMSMRTVDEREEQTAGLLARIDEINDEQQKLNEQLKQKQVAGITDDYFEEKTTKIFAAAGALHRSSHAQARRAPNAARLARRPRACR